MTEQDKKIQDLKAENERLKRQMEELIENNLDPIEMCKVSIALDKLKEYQNLEEQGLLLKLPCKVGDTVYSITRDFISEYIVESIRIYEHSIQFYWECTKGIYHNVVGFADFEIGKTVFLTEQEAQAALEKMKGGGVNG